MNHGDDLEVYQVKYSANTIQQYLGTTNDTIDLIDQIIDVCSKYDCPRVGIAIVMNGYEWIHFFVDKESNSYYYFENGQPIKFEIEIENNEIEI